jgi:hypothetical protein
MMSMSSTPTPVACMRAKVSRRSAASVISDQQNPSGVLGSIRSPTWE